MGATNDCSTIYPPLLTSTSIRLLALEAGEGDSVVRCSVTVQDLHDDPSYAALSYTWGDPHTIPYRASEPTKTIWCNEKALLVTDNLHKALLRLRGLHLCPGKKLLLWADAICINQKDLTELGSQVSIMGKIFAKASTVITWLGVEDTNSQLAFAVMRQLEPIVPLWEVERGKGFNYAYNDRALFRKAGVPMVKDEEWGALLSFFERHYFHRCKIVQEISLARGAVLMCGNHFEDWGRLIDVSKFLLESTWIPMLEVVGKPSSVGPFWPTLAVPAIFSDIGTWCTRLHTDSVFESEAARSKIQANEAYSFLEALLQKTRYFDATDPRDAIFAMLSIASHVCESKIPEILFMKPNYFVPAQNVFVHISREILINTRRISLLSMVDRDQCETPGLPSWVPDFNAFSPAMALNFLSTGSHKLYNAFEDTPNSLHLSITDKVMHLNGILLDTITEIETRDRSHSPNSWVKMCLNLPGTYVNGKSRVDALWRTTIADQNGTKSPAPTTLGFAFRQYILMTSVELVLDEIEKFGNVGGVRTEILHECSGYDELAQDQPDDEFHLFPTRQNIVEFTTSLFAFRRAGAEEQINSMEQKAHVYMALLSAIKGKRKLFRTKNNLLGLGPGSMSAGDSVWFFPTSNTPFVLRCVEASTHELVGEAYLHGYMHGEIKEQGLTLQRVSIC